MSRRPATLLAMLLLAGLALSSPRANAAIAAIGDSCTDCLVVPDACCSALPNYQFPGAPVFSPNILVATRQATAFPYVVTIFDLASPLPTGPEDNDWALITRYNGPGVGWTADSLGTVFGLTLDEYGNIFVTHTAIYSGDLVGQVFGGGPGAIYRIDGVTGKITTFATLPNFLDTSQAPGEDLPGLGNITYDCAHKQFFVTNMEDGKIYRIKPVGVNGATGAVQQVFDPLGPDNGLNGWAPLGQRLWAVQIHGNRVFYSVWLEDPSAPSPLNNSIRSVQLDAAGVIMPGTDKLELVMPDSPALAYASFPGSNPVSDISFNAVGDMLLGERSMASPTYSSAHASRVLEYKCVNFCWQRTNPFDVGDCCGAINSAGGVDYDRQTYGGPSSPIGRAWASGDALHLGSYADVIYGLQGFRPTGGNITNSMLIDSDGIVNGGDKSYQGDVEKPGCPPVTVGSICGLKFLDANHNGVLDGGEATLPNWPITLNGPGGPYNMTTDANGNYCFGNLVAGTYTVGEGAVAGYVQTLPAGGTYSVTLATGQTVGGKDFGNYLCGTGNCVPMPTGMTGWWPFNEATTSATAADLTHLSPARNVMQLFGGAQVSAGGAVGNALCFPSELDYAVIPNSNQVNLNVAGQPFSMDAWIRVPASSGIGRMLVDKRTLVSSSPYQTSGYALYLDGMQLMLELGWGTSMQVIPGPFVPANTWTHFAVSVSHAPAAGTWYLNGSAQAAFNFAPTLGFAYSTAPFYVGHANPAFASGEPLQGCIDELEFFYNHVLPAAKVAEIYNAGAAGKCRDVVRLPAVTSICKNDTSVTVCFNICNTAATTATYHWSLAGLPVGPGCTVAGPVVFNPGVGSITLGPGTCSVPICVTIPRPAGLTAQNATSCFALTVLNDSTGRCQTKQGSIRADNTCWCVKANTSGVVGVAARALLPGMIGVPIDIGVGHPCPPIDRLSYAVSVRFEGGSQNDPHQLRLNGLPPGEPVMGTLDFSPLPEQTVTVYLSWDGEHDLGAPYSIVIEADTDGDGVMEEMCSVPVASEFDGSGVTAVPPSLEGGGVLALRVAPNPFFGASSVTFTLPRTGNVELGVYDINGRLVRMLQRGTVAAGVHVLDWDGRDPQGHRVAAGVYFVRLDSPGSQLKSKLVKLR